jgi:hypothetical protein
LALWNPVPASAEPQASDPVEEFQRVLHMGRDGEKDLERLAKAVVLPGDLRRALTIEGLDEKDPDGSLRAGFAKRLEESLRQVLQTGDSDRRQAALVMIGDMGTWVRGTTPTKSFARVFEHDLLALVAAKDEPLCAAAARALVRIHPDPQAAAKALAGLLTAREVAERRAAAEALGQLVQAARTAAMQSSSRTEEVSPEQAIHTAVQVAPAAGGGLSDAEADVRRLCLEAIRQAALTLQILAPYPEMFSGRGGPGAPGVARDKPVRLMLLAKSLSEQVPALTRALKDTEVGVCLSANQTLETMAEARLQLRSSAAAEEVASGKPAEDPLRAPLRAAVPVLADELFHKDVRIRLASLYVLETLQVDATPAAAALVQALEDGNLFVRWPVYWTTRIEMSA